MVKPLIHIMFCIVQPDSHLQCITLPAPVKYVLHADIQKFVWENGRKETKN